VAQTWKIGNKEADVSVRIRTCVIEVSKHDDWRSGPAARPRDLLPWADPYIAQLVRRLEDRYDNAEDDRCDPFAAADAPWNHDVHETEWAGDEWPDDGWREDAFMPRPQGAPRMNWLPIIYGEFPLLEDLE
jgi:hypothetical protein